MRRRLPPLKTLPAFEIAADRLSFTQAAGELHLTHGAVSRQIKALESHLGVPLFRRRNRRIELTEAGAALLPGVRQALQTLEASMAEIASSPRHGALVVSCVATFMMRWLIPRLYAFNEIHRKIEVRLTASHAPVDFARDGIDIAIRLGRPPWPRNVIGSPFLADRLGPVCASALLEGRKRLRISDLCRHRLLHAETRTQAWSDWARTRGVAIDLADSQGFEHTYFMLEAAASGLGIGIASYPLVEHELKSGRLIAPFGFAPSGRSYCVLHARQTANNAKIAAFRSWIISAACSDRADGEGHRER
ncbi:MAG TPA: transcriptional regulator GcvA [Xanthobacteraceae bacterium]|jgi:DNA-binding transcriptional LysR family regulator